MSLTVSLEYLLILQEYCLQLERRFLPKLGNWWDPDPGAGALLHIFLVEHIRSSGTLEHLNEQRFFLEMCWQRVSSYIFLYFQLFNADRYLFYTYIERKFQYVAETSADSWRFKANDQYI